MLNHNLIEDENVFSTPTNQFLTWPPLTSVLWATLILLMIWSCSICSLALIVCINYSHSLCLSWSSRVHTLYRETVLERIFSIWTHETNHVLLLAQIVISIWANLCLHGESRTFGTTRWHLSSVCTKWCLLPFRCATLILTPLTCQYSSSAYSSYLRRLCTSWLLTSVSFKIGAHENFFLHTDDLSRLS